MEETTLPVRSYLNKENQQNSQEVLGQDPTSVFSKGERGKLAPITPETLQQHKRTDLQLQRLVF